MLSGGRRAGTSEEEVSGRPGLHLDLELEVVAGRSCLASGVGKMPGKDWPHKSREVGLSPLEESNKRDEVGRSEVHEGEL